MLRRLLPRSGPSAVGALPAGMIRCIRTMPRTVPKQRTESIKPEKPAKSRPSKNDIEGAVIADLPPIGYPPWREGMAPRYSWPLFGMADCPPFPPNIDKIVTSVFAKGARYLGDEGTCLQRPLDAQWAEMTVIGRSNVGKSSLLNALLGSKDDTFVAVSKHPGSTAHLDFYGLGTSATPFLVLVDTPGYGYNRRGKSAGNLWLELLTDYYRQRNSETMPRSLMLIDSKLGITKMDEEILTMLDGLGIPYHVVLTKADTISTAALETTAMQVATRLAKNALPFPVLSAVSAKTGHGVAELKRTVVLSTKVYRQLLA